MRFKPIHLINKCGQMDVKADLAQQQGKVVGRAGARAVAAASELQKHAKTYVLGGACGEDGWMVARRASLHNAAHGRSAPQQSDRPKQNGVAKASGYCLALPSSWASLGMSLYMRAVTGPVRGRKTSATKTLKTVWVLAL